jgi:hypothetical protein
VLPAHRMRGRSVNAETVYLVFEDKAADIVVRAGWNNARWLDSEGNPPQGGHRGVTPPAEISQNNCEP